MMRLKPQPGWLDDRLQHAAEKTVVLAERLDEAVRAREIPRGEEMSARVLDVLQAHVVSKGTTWTGEKGDFKVFGEGTRLVASTETSGASCAINSMRMLKVEQGAVLESTGTVYGKTGISVTEGSTLDVDVLDGNSSHAVETGKSSAPSVSGSIVVNDSTLAAQSQGVTVFGCGDESNGSDFTVKNNSTVDLYSSSAIALQMSGEVVLESGAIILKGATTAISLPINNSSVDFGSDPDWYQWATSPAGAVKPAATDPYTYAGDTSTYLRFEPAGTTYDLTVESGTGGGSYAPGTQVAISTDSYDKDGHFTGWTVDDPTGAGVLASSDAASTTFTMPAGDVTLTANSEGHALTHVAGKDPTCTEAGWEAYDECACGYSTINEIPATGHSFVDGACTVCGAEDPDYAEPEVPGRDTPGPQDPEDPDQGDPDPEKPGQEGTESEPVPEKPAEPAGEKADPAILATGDASAFFSAVPALVGASAVTVSARLRRRR